MGLISLGCSFLLGIFLATQRISVVLSSTFLFILFATFFYFNKGKQVRLWAVMCFLALVGGFLRGQISVFPDLNMEDIPSWAWFANTRSLLARSLAIVLPEPQSSLAQALLLGIRDNIPTTLLNDFATTGTSHIMAISGLNISIIAGVFLSVGVWLFGRQRPLYLILPLCAVWGYTLLSGAFPSALRAAIMASLFLMAEGIGRQRGESHILIFTAALMVGIQPALLENLSFQLSFLGMAGLIFITPWFHNLGIRMLGTIPKWGNTGFPTTVIDTIAVSLGAVIATAPLIAYRFQTFSLASIPATILILPVITPIMIMSFIVSIAGLYYLPLAYVLGWIVWLFSSYMILIVEWFAGLPFVAPKVSLPVVEVCIYYIILAIIIWVRTIKVGLNNIISQIKKRVDGVKTSVSSLAARKSFQRWTLSIVAIIAVLLWIALLTLPDGNLYVSFLDVGQGDAIFIEKGNQQILIDGGPDPNKLALELGRRMPFWDRRIELLILTHAQDDHISGLLEVLQRYKVDSVMEPGHEYDTEEYRKWLELINRKNISYVAAYNGQSVDLGDGVILKILHPQQETQGNAELDVNNSSVVVKLVDDKASFLLTGDIEETVEYQLLHSNGKDLSSVVLKVAHHGSDSSTTELFLNAVNPKIAVISAGENNRYGLPNLSIVKRLANQLGDNNIYLTANQGTITFCTDGEKMWIETER